MAEGRQQPSLLQLPAPLQERISQFLGHSNTPALRATCKALRAAAELERVCVVLHIGDPEHSTQVAEQHEQDWVAALRLSKALPSVAAADVAVTFYSEWIHLQGIHSALQQLYPAAGALSHWKQLQDVRAPMSKAVVEKLVDNCTQLRALELSGELYRGRIREQLMYDLDLWASFQRLATCSTLRHLTLHRTGMSVDSASRASAVGSLTQLLALDLLGCEFSSNRLLKDSLRPLTQLTKLQLSIEFRSDNTDSLVLGPFPLLAHLTLVPRQQRGPIILVGCSQLKHFSLPNTYTWQQAYSLSNSEPWQHLQHLNLGNNMLTDSDLACLAASCPQLTSLSAAGLTATAGCTSKLPTLQALNVYGMSVACEGQLASIMPSLTSLKHKDCPFTRIGQPHSPHFLHGHTALRHLQLADFDCMVPPLRAGADAKQLLDPLDLTSLQALTSLSLTLRTQHTFPQMPPLFRALTHPSAWARIRRVTVCLFSVVIQQCMLLLQCWLPSMPHLQVLGIDAAACPNELVGAATLLGQLQQLQVLELTIRSFCKLGAEQLTYCRDDQNFLAGIEDSDEQEPHLLVFLQTLARNMEPAGRPLCVRLLAKPVTEWVHTDKREVRAVLLQDVRWCIDTAGAGVPAALGYNLTVHIDEVEMPLAE